MNATPIVIDAKRLQLSLQIQRIPEVYSVEIFSANGTDQSFHKRMRNRHIGNRFDLLDFEHAKVREPAMKLEQRIVISADVLRQQLASDGAIEHSTHGDAIDVGALDAKADDAAGKNIYHQHHPVATQQD